MKTVFFTGINNGFDAELLSVFSENGYEVYVSGALVPDYIDIYIETANYKSDSDDFSVEDDIDYDAVYETYAANVLKPLETYEEFLPLIKLGSVKRLCFITGSGAGINNCSDVSGFGYNMSKAGLHNFLQIIKNRLSPEGFTFRAFDPSGGEISDKLSAVSAFNYFTRRRGVEGGRDDEPKFVIRDAFGRERSW